MKKHEKPETASGQGEGPKAPHLCWCHKAGTKKTDLTRNLGMEAGLQSLEGNGIWGREVQEVSAPLQRQAGLCYRRQARKQGQGTGKRSGGKSRAELWFQTPLHFSLRCTALSSSPPDLPNLSCLLLPRALVSCLDCCNSLHIGLTPPVLPLAVQTPHCGRTDSSIRKSSPCYLCFTSLSRDELKTS